MHLCSYCNRRTRNLQMMMLATFGAMSQGGASPLEGGDCSGANVLPSNDAV